VSENPSKLGQELRVQLDVFNDQKEGDEAAARTDGPLSSGVDLNSHLDVFYAILRQVNYVRRPVFKFFLWQNSLF